MDGLEQRGGFANRTRESRLAKKVSTLRVFQIAKDLGVDSKDIVAKCQAEGVEGIQNHMSTVSLGLAATIREWFGASASTATTAVETAARVDLEQVRAKARRKSRSSKVASASAEPVDGGDTATAVAEPPPVAKPPAARRRAAAAASPEPDEPSPTMSAAGLAPADATSASPGSPPEAAAPPIPLEHRAPPAAPPAPKPVMNVPERPEVVKPAGPMLQQPTKSKLSGPKVIRVEPPEVLSSPGSRGPRHDSPMGRGGPRAGRGVGMAPGSMPEAPTEPGRGGRSDSRRNKRRSATARTDDASGRLGRAFATNEDRPFNWREQDLVERENRLNKSGGYFRSHRRDNLKKGVAGQRAQTARETGGRVRVSEPITIKELSAVTGVKTGDILRRLLLTGKAGTINSTIDAASATEIMLEYGIELEVVEAQTVEQQIAQQFTQRDMVDAQPRSPVVTILGHVDHGKTSLLDRIRNTNIAAGEAGGITQATRAFQVPVHAGDGQHLVTFIDTPGHEAFTEMRARGARVTDLVVLVVAADDGVMPQTVESINHAKAAAVPIVVALNKIDKPEATNANIQRILGQLADHGLNPVEWGGSTEVVRTSATQGEGIQDLLETLDYQAELLELKGDFGGEARGTVLEARQEEGRGAVANVIVQQGVMHRGDFVAVGRAFGRVRDIVNDRGERVDEAGPSTPVTFSGIDEIPEPGDKFYVVKSLRGAEDSALERRDQERQKSLAKERITLDNIFKHLEGVGRKELPLIVKADVQGSVDTLVPSLEKISSDAVTIAVKHAAVGGVNESDITLAQASGAIVIGFNVTASAKARQMADQKGVDIRFYDVIYDITDDVTKAAEGLLEPELKLEVLGHAEVRQVFRISRVGMIAGCYVTDGVIERNSLIRVTREGIVVEKDRRLEQLKRFKDDAREVRAGQECGMKIDGYDDIKQGDVLECYKTHQVRKSLKET
jgi:translation initiation factor IF-2